MTSVLEAQKLECNIQLAADNLNDMIRIAANAGVMTTVEVIPLYDQLGKRDMVSASISVTPSKLNGVK